MHNSKPARTSKEAKTGQIICIKQEQLNKHLDKVVPCTVERTLNELLDADADNTSFEYSFNICNYGLGYSAIRRPVIKFSPDYAVDKSIFKDSGQLHGNS